MKFTKVLAAAGVAVAVGLGTVGCGAGQSPSDTKGGTIAEGMIFGGPAEFKTRADGIPGLEKNYNIKFGKYTVTDTGGPVTVTQLKNGQIDAADLFTTDPSIKANDFVVLEDPKNNFAAQNVTPLINKDKAKPGVVKTLDAISAKLTTESLLEMVGAVQDDKKDPAAVAKKWLADNGLDKAGASANGETLKVGSANFPENVVLAEIYAQALQAQGAKVTTKLNIGAREKYFPALKAGSIDVFPEYVGTVLGYLDKKATATDSQEVYDALKKELPSNLQALTMSKAEDSDGIVVTKKTAEKYGLKTIADLAKKK